MYAPRLEGVYVSRGKAPRILNIGIIEM